MEESIKIAHIKNLNNFNFNTTLSVPIDSKSNIKTLLDVSTNLCDVRVECGNGKAIITGKICLHAVYLDSENLTCTIKDQTNFSETFIENSITSETVLNLTNSNIINNILSSEQSLKINCEVSIATTAYINLPIDTNLNLQDSIITKKSNCQTYCISQNINSSFDHTSSFETNDTISKILSLDTYFVCEKVVCENDYFVVEGKTTNKLIYEVIDGENRKIKELKETDNVKYDIQLAGLTKEMSIDVSFAVDKLKQEVSTEIEDNQSLVTAKNTISITGVVLKNVNIDIVDDLYSLENEVETSQSSRELASGLQNLTTSEIILNELSLSNEEPAIDEIISNINCCAEITNTYIKNSTLYVEGLVSSNLIYIDENKEIQHKQIEVPFLINTKQPLETLNCFNNIVSILDNRVKVKRGTVIEIEYTLFLSMTCYEKAVYAMVDNFKIGKALNLNKYDFQIFVAKQGETLWDLCKRIKISPTDINKNNKDLPLIMNGGEKIVIRR